MNRRILAALLAVLLCMTALLSGALLILHKDHGCINEACAVCMLLERGAEILQGLFLVCLAVSATVRNENGCLFASLENQRLPDWTPVRRKVKMQD